MLGLMQSHPLLVSSLIEHASRLLPGPALDGASILSGNAR